MHISLTNNIKLSIIGSFLFFFTSLIFEYFKISGIYEIIPSFLYFILCVYIFSNFALKDNLLLILPWFLLCSSLFISFGSLGSLLRYNFSEVGLQQFERMVSISYANSLNSLSILIITCVAYFFIKKNFNFKKINSFFNELLKFKTYIFIGLYISLILKIIFYFKSVPEHYVLSILTKVSLLEDGLFFYYRSYFLD